MINEIIYWELYALVVSFFNGVLLAWIYDNIRAFRRIVRHKTVAFMSVEDIIYGIYAGLSVFVMCFKVADGIIRVTQMASSSSSRPSALQRSA